MTEDLYRAPQAELIDPPRAEQLALAARETRLAATILDQLVMLPALIPIVVGFAISGDGDAAEPFRGQELWLLLTLVLLLAILAVNTALMARDGQTIGKRWLRIRVVRSDGSPLSLGRYVGLRVLPVNLLALIPILGNVVALADPLLIFRDNHKCLHDELADTIVVKA